MSGEGCMARVMVYDHLDHNKLHPNEYPSHDSIYVITGPGITMRCLGYGNSGGDRKLTCYWALYNDEFERARKAWLPLMDLEENWKTRWAAWE